MAWFRRYVLAEKSLFGLLGPPVGLLVTGGPETPFLGRKMGVEAARGDTVKRCGRKKVAGGPYRLRGEGFGPF